jgi:plasmid stabilization system protein ParE
VTHQVRIHRLARLDLRDAYEWTHARAPSTVDRWFDRFREAIRSLELRPERCPLAAENRKVSFEVRELHFGQRPNVFRVIFHIDGNDVRVLRILRVPHRDLGTSDLLCSRTKPTDARYLPNTSRILLDTFS